jgi:glutathione S-transferase
MTGRRRGNAQHKGSHGEIFVKLLWSSRSPFVRNVVAHELGIADRIELQRVNVTASSTNAEVMRFNPLNKIPTLLLDDGSVMIDSPVIAEYLDETYGKGGLFPGEMSCSCQRTESDSPFLDQQNPLLIRQAPRRRHHDLQHRPPRRKGARRKRV